MLVICSASSAGPITTEAPHTGQAACTGDELSPGTGAGCHWWPLGQVNDDVIQKLPTARADEPLSHTRQGGQGRRAVRKPVAATEENLYNGPLIARPAPAFRPVMN